MKKATRQEKTTLDGLLSKLEANAVLDRTAKMRVRGGDDDGNGSVPIIIPPPPPGG